MSDDFESSDILGNALPVGRGRVSATSTFSSLLKYSLLGACGLFALIVFRHGRTFFLRWKERHYKLSMRRRYGIPDHDQRPFNVAYAAARLAQEDGRKAQSRLGLQSAVGRQRQGGVEMATGLEALQPRAGVTGRGASAKNSVRARVAADLQATQDMADGAILGPPTAILAQGGIGRDNERRNLTTPVRTDSPLRSSALSFREPMHSLRLTSVRAESRQGTPHLPVVEPDEVAGQFTPSEEPKDTTSFPEDVNIRTKRTADSGDDGDLESNLGRRHDKRRRKVSNRQKSLLEEAEDVDMVDELSDLPASHRGKKRHRAEAGSTFGGEEDSFFDDQDEDKSSRHRRRRQRQSLTSHRGQKRGRDDEDLSTSDSDGDERRSRGKASRQRQDHYGISDSDVSMDGTQASQDPLCKGRRVGEEWEAFGVEFKVGPDGRRLRKVLVKEDRPKFSMPVDSEHPDRAVSVIAIVERWYNEDEYREAKARRELAWQDKSSTEPETPNSAPEGLNISHGRRSLTHRQESPLPPGKELLWSSTSMPSSPIRKSQSFGQSVATNLGLRITSLSQAQPSHIGRRVTSLYASSMVKPPEMSPKLRSSKSYSKWEKQEIEAEAMARLRRKTEEEKAKKDMEQRKITEQKAAAEKAASDRAAADKAAAAAKESQLGGVASTPVPTNAGLPNGIKSADAASAKPDSFKPSFPPVSSQPSAAENKLAPSTGTFTPPAQPLFNAPTQPPSSSISNFFSKDATPATAPTEPKPAPFTPTATPAPSVFSFGPSAHQPKGNPPTATSSLFSAPTASSATSSPANSNVPPIFGVKSSEAVKPSPLGQSSFTAPTKVADAPSSAGGRFSFGLPGKPAVTSGTQSTSGKSEEAKPTPATFSFGPPKPSQPTPTPVAESASSQRPAVPSFTSFGPGAGNEKPTSSLSSGVFNFNSAPGSQSSALNTSSGDNAKAPASTPNPFAPSSTAPSVFSFGTPAKPTPSDASKTAFPFTTSTTASASGTPATPAKSSFSFAAPGASSAATPAPVKTFPFGSPFNAGASATTPAASGAPAPSASGGVASLFGQTSSITPSAFGFGQPSSTGGSFTFGTTAQKAEKS
ncbi:hypothetical protein FA95DRAFT_463916 [Auriscalpium vulgare]|uniref:Uncharacterized protein n=1 Tax=Auriscalpium vulgare TaxID=40419 RepID=A0ACB8SCD5_9AGAM|nr:hypothetical protein FA95DRAFT_463916 [Auriscalpium vulgare]